MKYVLLILAISTWGGSTDVKTPPIKAGYFNTYEQCDKERQKLIDAGSIARGLVCAGEKQ